MNKSNEATVINASEGNFKLQRIYVKNSLFESTMPPSLLLQEPNESTVTMEVNADVYDLNKDINLHEVVLTLHVVAKIQDKLIWRIQHQHAGLYITTELDDKQEKRLLNGFCMSQLYSYASAEITRIVIQAGFSPIYLDMLNFEHLYVNRKPLSVM